MGPGEVGPPRLSCNRRERGPRGTTARRRRRRRPRQPQICSTTNTGWRWHRRGTWPANLSARLPARPSPLDVRLLQCQHHANGVSIHWPHPARPSCTFSHPGITIVQDTRHRHKLVRVLHSGIPPTAPKHKHKHQAPIPLRVPEPTQKSNAPKRSDKKETGESRQGLRTMEAVTVDSFTTYIHRPLMEQSGSPADRDGATPFAQTFPMQEPIDFIFPQTIPLVARPR